MEKSPEAFRTISEVADWLGVPTHVLRFWESRFAQIKPVKRAGGRRYYRPSDMALIGGIKRLLHDDGMTIRGAQKLLREKGVKHVASLSKPLDGAAQEDEGEVIDATAVDLSAAQRESAPPVPDTAPPAPPPDAVAPEPASPEAPAEVAGAPQESPRPEDEPVPDESGVEDTGTAAGGEIEETPAAAKVIADIPDMHESDPEDDDTAFPGTPGLAARVRIANPRYLRRNRDALRLLKDKLPARASA